MKKIVALGLFFSLFTLAASAQRDDVGFKKQDNHRKFEDRSMTRGDRFNNDGRGRDFKRGDKRFKHDRKLSRAEKRKLYKMRHHYRKHGHHRSKYGRRHHRS